MRQSYEMVSKADFLSVQVPQRQKFPQFNTVVASPYACHPSCRLLRGRYTSDFFPQRQHFPQSGDVAASPYACHPSCRPLRGRCTSDFFPQRQHFPRLGAVADSRWDNDTSHSTCQEAVTGYSCHNGSNSRDSMPLRYRAKRKRLQKRLPQDATKMQNFCTALGFCDIRLRRIYWGASAVQIEQVHLHRSRLLRIFTA